MPPVVIALIVLACVLAFWGLSFAFTNYERRRAMQEFESALTELRKDPDNKTKRDAALVRGRTYWHVRRNGAPIHDSDEKAVREKIDAVIFEDTMPANRFRARVGKAKIANASNLRKSRIEDLGKGTWAVSGRIRLKQIQEDLGFTIDGDGSETLAALVATRLMREPKFGDHVLVGDLDITVTKTADGRATRLYIRKVSTA